MNRKIKKKKRNRAIILVIVAMLAASLCWYFGLFGGGYVKTGEPLICLDAGHGGYQVGATKDERYEKDDDFRLTLAVREKLEKMGMKTVLTREDDSDVSLKDRCKLANRKNCSLFVSIHRNSADSEDAQGVEAWISKRPKGDEKALAENLLESICTVTGQQNRGVKNGYRDATSSDFYINADTNMPSLLLEVGFITNEKDNIAFDERLDETAEAIAKAIYDYSYN